METKVKEVVKKSTWVVSGLSLAVLAVVGLIRHESDPGDEVVEAQPEEEIALFVG